MVNREELDRIVIKNDTKDWWQPDLFIHNTKHLLPPELEVLSNPPAEELNYNCFIYILALHENPGVLRETGGFIYDSFLKHLLDIGELQKTDTPSNGDYVAYQDLQIYPENLTHIGVLQADKIVSKWAWGPLIRHSLWDVPAEYGNDVFYIQSVSTDKAYELYEKYKEFNVKP